MQAIDYSQLLESTALRGLIPPAASLDEDIYEREEGLQFRCTRDKRQIYQEIVRLADGAFLFASEDAFAPEHPYRQVINDSDWVHIQFRLNGGGSEHIGESGVLRTPEKCCIVARYPENSVIERTVDRKNGWKVACLFAKPAALTSLMDVSASRLPESVLWMAIEGSMELRSSIVPLQSSMTLAVNDILSCAFRGGNRRVYMRAKSLELLSTVIHALASFTPTAGPTIRLLPADLEKISRARSLMVANLETTLTLAELARRVGLNRTKLALGFKGVYGISVQAFWRDAKLDRAREMLHDGEIAVSEVALSLGYSELSSFSRAFSRRFGVVPRDCRLDRRTILSRD